MYENLPGFDIITAGVDDLRAGRRTIAACLVSMASGRLAEIGIDLPAERVDAPEQELYRLVAEDQDCSPHSVYNAWRRRLSSFLRAASCAKP